MIPPRLVNDTAPRSPLLTEAELSTENLRPQILQHTLQQISSSTIKGSAECCVICLGHLKDRCEAQPCRHSNFDYLCLVTWLQERATCPLCNSNVHEVRYELSEDGRQGKVYKLPEPSEGSDRLNEQAERGSIDRNSDDSNRSVRAQLPHVDEVIQRRRFVYRHNLYSRHVGSNMLQPAGSAYKELSPQQFRTDPELISRARMWLRRELRIFQYLNTSGEPDDREPVRGRKSSNADFLLEYVLAILKNIDIQDSTGQAEIMIEEFLGRKHTPIFLRELKTWLRSPSELLSAWDREVQYSGGNTLPSVSHNKESGLREASNIVLKYSEPAEARKSPSSQAWRLYVFRGDSILDIIELWERSVWLLGRDERVADVVIPHPSCSGQHAALQFRYTVRKEAKREDKDKSCVKLYVIDLDSTHSTCLNSKRIDSNRYVEIRHKDVIQFGASKREYVIILPPT